MPKSAKIISIISLVLILGIILFFYIPFNYSPPGDTRMILDHDKQTYIAPPCFNQANATNYIEETTYDKVEQSGYRPNSACTEREIAP